jgi:hypothetical protein
MFGLGSFGRGCRNLSKTPGGVFGVSPYAPLKGGWGNSKTPIETGSLKASAEGVKTGEFGTELHGRFGGFLPMPCALFLSA